VGWGADGDLPHDTIVEVSRRFGGADAVLQQIPMKLMCCACDVVGAPEANRGKPPTGGND